MPKPSTDRPEWDSCTICTAQLIPLVRVLYILTKSSKPRLVSEGDSGDYWWRLGEDEERKRALSPGWKMLHHTTSARKFPPTTTPSTGSFLNVQSRRANDFSVFPFRKQWQDPPKPLIEILEQTPSVRNPFFFSSASSNIMGRLRSEHYRN